MIAYITKRTGIQNTGQACWCSLITVDTTDRQTERERERERETDRQTDRQTDILSTNSNLEIWTAMKCNSELPKGEIQLFDHSFISDFLHMAACSVHNKRVLRYYGSGTGGR